jgi:hypothetical protein
MSKFAVKGIIAAVLAVATSAAMTAQDTATLSVSARIQGGCTLVTSGAMAFGDLNMASTGPESKVVNATYRCASGVIVTSFTVGGDGDGSYTDAMTSTTTGVTDTIPYTITWSVPASYTGTGFTAAGQTVALTGTIQNADYITKAPGSYTDSVVLAVNY